MTAFAPAYVPATTVDLASDADRLVALQAMRRSNSAPVYEAQAFLVASDGSTTDLTQDLVKTTDGQVEWDCTGDVQGDATFGLTSALQWGSDVVSLYQLIQSRAYNLQAGYNADAFIRFPLGHYVVTTPGYDDLDINDYRKITGFSKNYLLQSGLIDAYPFAAGPMHPYKDAVQSLFRAALVPNFMDAGATLDTVCDYPQDWAAKTLATPVNFTPDVVDSYLAAINQLLKASGMGNLFVQPNGRWKIDDIPIPATQSPRWRWTGSGVGDPYDRITATDVAGKTVLRHQQQYSGDVWGVPNQWVFIQNGLTFQPIEGSGQYTVNNVGTPPSGQNLVGRVVRSTQYLDASGQADLTAQGDAIVAEALGKAEQISLQTTPWPIARQYDVFYFLHKALPFDSMRRLQVQRWTLPLWGEPMAWETNAVSIS